ncbi:Kinesin light chain [Beauveria bassiana]|uniref:Kinesin light chain n=2 Tax=Beauveria bassiana TaxID=176275 RepID=A0A2N6N912_BEABA|nr:Kinesin light chain [Beauveria bassiana]PMB63762.1 Kinesin light chain [Beauveria bassiana]
MNTTAFGDLNSGLQARTIQGPVTAEFHYYPPQGMLQKGINTTTPRSRRIERPETPPAPSILIPFGRDNDYVERREIHNQIERRCGRPGSRTALVGLGGVGKTQLAIEYAYRSRERPSNTWVFWIHASNGARFEKSFRDIANFIKVPGRQDPKANIFRLVHDWLQDEKKGLWVIILDNVDDVSFLKQSRPDTQGEATSIETAYPRQLVSYIPYCPHGSVLVTSRSKGAALELVEHADIILIEPMNENDALRLFQKKLGQSDNEACTTELAAALEYMPLAIVQAAAYVIQMRPRYSLQKYLDEFLRNDRRKTKLLSQTGGELRRDAEAKNSILITWHISFDYIRKSRPSAADLLSLMSFCDRQGIPDVLLRSPNDQTRRDDEQNQRDGICDSGVRDEHTNAGDDESIDSGSDSDSDLAEQQSNYSDIDRFESDVVTLRNFSFIIANEDGTTFEMHRLVQLATLQWLRAQDVYDQWRREFLVRLCAEFPSGEYENWSKCQALFPHALSVSTQRPATNDSIQEWATVLYRAAWFALEQGKGTEAEELSVQAMKARKKIFGKEHEDLISSKAMVASAYRLRGRWSEAEKIDVQVMETSKMKLGADHPSTLTGMANLASTYRKQGRWEEAERLEVQVMETSKTKLGANHPDTLTSTANLASTYRNQCRWEEAERLFVQVMETSKTKLGANHPDTLTSMANLASTYRNQGRWGEAERLEVQVMETRKTKFGADHPDTLTSMANLASTYRNQGRWGEAERLDVQVMETRKTKFGADHPDTLTSMHNLAYSFKSLGRLNEALDLMDQCSSRRQRILGLQHPHTKSSKQAMKLWQQGSV